MTKLRLYLRGESPVRFELEGHSGYAEEGHDIVCAAITSALRLFETSLNDAFNFGALVEVDEKRAFISIDYPAGLDEDSAGICDKLFAGFISLMRTYASEYPENIELEVYANA